MPGDAELRLRDRLGKLRSLSLLGGTRLSGELERLQRQLDRLEAEPTGEEIWRSVELARHPDRPYTLDYVERLVEDWVELHEAGVPMFSVLSHPTTGGVIASFASLGDVTIAEPGALLAFTGPRVVQSIVKEKLPEDFGRAEQNLRFGHVDAIVPRSEQRVYLARLLRLFAR